MGSAVIVETVRTPVAIRPRGRAGTRRRYLKRAHCARLLFGDPARHAAAIAASLLDQQ